MQIRALSDLRRFGLCPSYRPTTLFVRVNRFRKGLRTKQKAYSHLADHWRLRRLLTIFELWKIKFAVPLTLLFVDWITVGDRMKNSFWYMLFYDIAQNVDRGKNKVCFWIRHQEVGLLLLLTGMFKKLYKSSLREHK